jgi:site-specific recombinase XerD
VAEIAEYRCSGHETAREGAGDVRLPAQVRLTETYGLRTRALIVLCWRLHISEALAVRESDLDGTRGAVLVRQGKGSKWREIGMDRRGWQPLAPWSSTA